MFSKGGFSTDYIMTCILEDSDSYIDYIRKAISQSPGGYKINQLQLEDDHIKEMVYFCLDNIVIYIYLPLFLY